jgi:hypothetical protein
MAFDPGKVNKLQDQLESIAYDWMLDRICSVYGVGEVVELSQEQISEVFEYANGFECDTYVAAALFSMIHEWESEHGEDISGDTITI